MAKQSTHAQGESTKPRSEKYCVHEHETRFAHEHETRFARWFVLVFVCLSSIVFVFKRTDLFPWVGQCNSSGYNQEYYLAYCHSTRYGDYEHYAMYRGLEPQAVESLKQAQVLFLGNSNTQYAFSTDAIKRYFKKTGVLHYVMGFGQGAKSPVAQAVITQHQLQAQMLVANVDPFFSDETNGTFERVLDDPDGISIEFDRKRKLQHWQARMCATQDSRWHRWVCQGNVETLYRSRINGHWLTDYYRENLQHPVTESAELVDVLDEAVHAANAFIADVNVQRQCIVLTVTPRTGTPVQFAKALAQRLQLPLIVPELDGLVTIDHSHLDRQSAQRWSTQFVKAFDPYTKACIR